MGDDKRLHKTPHYTPYTIKKTTKRHVESPLESLAVIAFRRIIDFLPRNGLNTCRLLSKTVSSRLPKRRLPQLIITNEEFSWEIGGKRRCLYSDHFTRVSQMAIVDDLHLRRTNWDQVLANPIECSRNLTISAYCIHPEQVKSLVDAQKKCSGLSITLFPTSLPQNGGKEKEWDDVVRGILSSSRSIRNHVFHFEIPLQIVVDTIEKWRRGEGRRNYLHIEFPIVLGNIQEYLKSLSSFPTEMVSYLDMFGERQYVEMIVISSNEETMGIQTCFCFGMGLALRALKRKEDDSKEFEEIATRPAHIFCSR